MRSLDRGARTSFLALTLALGAGCDASHMRGDDAGPAADASSSPDAGGCVGTGPMICVSSCGSDFGHPPVCVDGRFECPIGTVDLSTCPPFCMGAPPSSDCRCEPPRWVCPPPPPPGPLACPVELEPSLGLACGVEGQTCGDPCCELTLACEGGTWGPGPIADCAACHEAQYFPCGPGRCGRGQACQVDCGPDDGPVFSCQVLVDDCGGCGCVEVPPGSTCEERDGHLYVLAPRCG